MTKDVRPGVLCPLLIFSPQLFACIKKKSNFANWKYLLILKYI